MIFAASDAAATPSLAMPRQRKSAVTGAASIKKRTSCGGFCEGGTFFVSAGWDCLAPAFIHRKTRAPRRESAYLPLRQASFFLLQCLFSHHASASLADSTYFLIKTAQNHSPPCPSHDKMLPKPWVPVSVCPDRDALPPPPASGLSAPPKGAFALAGGDHLSASPRPAPDQRPAMETLEDCSDAQKSAWLRY